MRGAIFAVIVHYLQKVVNFHRPNAVNGYFFLFARIMSSTKFDSYSLIRQFGTTFEQVNCHVCRFSFEVIAEEA